MVLALSPSIIGRWSGQLPLATPRSIATITSMSVRLRKFWLPVALLGLVLWGDLAQAQFNPRGRKRPGASKPPSSAHPSPAPKRSPSTASPTRSKTGDRPPSTTPRDNGSQNGASSVHSPTTPPQTKSQPSSDVLIARYTAIALQQPGAAFPLQRLSELYRERDGNLDAFEADFEKRLTGSPKSLPILLALSWIAEGAGDRARAEELLVVANTAHPKHTAPLLALANLHESAGDKARAAMYLEQTLTLQPEALEREQTLRKLRGFALDSADVTRAIEYHDKLVQQSKGSSFVRGELAKELMDRRMYAEAVKASEAAVKAAQGDHRALAPALRDLAQAQAATGATDVAIKTLQRALSSTAADSGTYREVLELMVATYRAANRVPELLELLERDPHRSPSKLALLASLYEEGGRLDEALAAYRRALAVSPANTDVRLKLIHLLELRGDLDAAVTEYRQLVQTNPRNPEYVFRLADLYQKLGNPKAGLDELNRLGERSKSDPEVLAATIDFYERMGESDKALSLLEKLVAQAPRDHQHLVALGERYFAAGDEKRAQATWRKLLEVVPDRARAEFLLGEVYLEHDLTSEALRSLTKACELAPTNLQYKKTLALALERTGATSGKAARTSNYAEAQALWEKILTSADSPAAQREARQHITTLWSLQGSLQDRVAPLEDAFRRKPPHLPSGRMLSEVYQRLNQLPRAERVLRELAKLTPTDVATLATLERVLVAQRKLAEAANVAKRLLELEPKRALDHYQRLARYAADLYRDDDAIEYAAKAVALNPDDAEGQKRLGDMYRRRQDVERAVSHYRLALTKNDRLFPAYFDLAELLLLQGKSEEADHLLRTVVRSAVEDDVIARAARLSMQLHVSDGRLDKLEQELLPLSLTRTNKPIYRSLLLELYNAWMLPLVQQASSTNAQLSTQAQAQLVVLGQRSVKPLLDALTDPKHDQQRTAVELLSHIRNPNANLPLFTFATTTDNPDLQTRAMLAIGLAGGTNVLPQLESLLFADDRAVVDESSPLSLAAAWSYCALESKATTAKLLVLAQADSPTARALALVALSQRRDLRVLDVLPEQLHDGATPITRAAAAYAIGEVASLEPKAKSARSWPALLTELRALAQATDGLTRATALAALARLRDPQLFSLVARALIQPDPLMRDQAVRAMNWFAERETRGTPRNNKRFPAPSTDAGRLNAVRLIEELLPPRPTPEQSVALLPLLERALIQEARPALRQSEDAVKVISLALTTPPDLGWHPLTSELANVDPLVRSRALESAARIATELTPEFVVQSSHPDVAVRSAAVRVLTTQSSDEARSAIEAVFTRGDEETCRAVLATLVDFPNPALLVPVSELLGSNRPWPIRQLAARTLRDLAPSKRINAAPGNRVAQFTTTATTTVTAALLSVVKDDPNAFVREQALAAWAAWTGPEARSTLTSVAHSDPEVRVRNTAKELLQGLR